MSAPMSPKSPTSLPGLARMVLAAARARGLTIATAESCTGGMVASTLVGIAGSSDVLDRGFITYSNAAKTAMLGVPVSLLAEYGAVSAQTVAAMAQGALRAAGAGLSVAISGVAGPSGGSAEKPVGLVHLAVVSAVGGVNLIERRYNPALGRQGIRRAATRDALLMLLDLAKAESGAHFA